MRLKVELTVSLQVGLTKEASMVSPMLETVKRAVPERKFCKFRLNLPYRENGSLPAKLAFGRAALYVAQPTKTLWYSRCYGGRRMKNARPGKASA